MSSTIVDGGVYHTPIGADNCEHPQVIPDPNDYTLARVTFDSLEEGAAFIAALSRVIASPSGAVHEASSSAMEVLAAMTPSNHMDLFLSPGALATTRAAFGEPRVLEQVERRALPGNVMRLVEHWPNRGYGQEEIVQFFGALAGDDPSGQRA